MKPVAWIDRDGHYIRAVFYSATHKLNLPRRTKLYAECTADQLRQAKVEVLREAADDPVCGLVEQRMLRRMADELENAT